MLLTPIFFNARFRSSFFVYFKNEIIPISIALLEFTIQKAPPIIKIKAMIPACRSKPLKKAVKTCHVCGWFST